MIALCPPRAAELFLESLGATSEFRESLLCDLAQEFSEAPSAMAFARREAVMLGPQRDL